MEIGGGGGAECVYVCVCAWGGLGRVEVRIFNINALLAFVPLWVSSGNLNSGSN